MTLEALSVFSPMPPEENGIADYSFHLLRSLVKNLPCSVFADDPQSIVPDGVSLRDPLQAFRFIESSSKVLHQIGNNPGHVFVLNALRQWGGVTTLHDQNLHYLYEVAGADALDMARGMAATSAKMGAAYARHWRKNGVKTKANYTLFDMLDEVLSASSAVIVHSDFAKRRLRALYGQSRSAHVEVIPHLALPFEGVWDQAVLSRFKVPIGRPLIVTSGFATYAKRFDWIVTALEEVVRRGTEFFWVHAGRERPEEYDLSGLLERAPTVKRKCVVTGYLKESELNSLICAADILVNLRFPSVGESSGTLARALSATKCCVVSDTAAYSDLPREAVVHIPIAQPVARLAETLDGLLKNPSKRRAIGLAAKKLVETEWAPGTVAKAYQTVIEQRSAPRLARASRGAAPAEPPRILVSLNPHLDRLDVIRALGDLADDVEIVFEAGSMDDLVDISLARAGLLSQLLPLAFQTTSVRIVADGEGGQHYAKPQIVVKGRLR